MRPVISLLNNSHSLTRKGTHVFTPHAFTHCNGIRPSQPTITLISGCLLKIHGPQRWQAAYEQLPTIINRTTTNKSRFQGDWNGFLQKQSLQACQAVLKVCPVIVVIVYLKLQQVPIIKSFHIVCVSYNTAWIKMGQQCVIKIVPMQLSPYATALISGCSWLSGVVVYNGMGVGVNRPGWQALLPWW